MTKRQILLKAAKLWDKPNCDSVGCYIFVNGYMTDGVCDTLKHLGMDEDERREIRHLLPKEKPSGYCWSFTRSGAKARAAWCRKTAAKLAKKTK